jgi:hypothetical protein
MSADTFGPPAADFVLDWWDAIPDVPSCIGVGAGDDERHSWRRVPLPPDSVVLRWACCREGCEATVELEKDPAEGTAGGSRVTP